MAQVPQPARRLTCSFAGRGVDMAMWQRGDLVELDGLLAVVVGVEGDPGVPEEHVAVWFGDPRCRRKSQGGRGGERPEVWTVPEAYFVPASEPVFKH